MSSPFSMLKSRINAVVFSRLADAEAVLSGGATVAGIFRPAGQDSFGLMPTDRATFEAPTSALSAVQVDDALTIASVSYTVVAVHPDGAGAIRLELK